MDKGRGKLPRREVVNIKDNAFSIRDRKNVTLDGITKIKFAIREAIERFKTPKLDQGIIEQEKEEIQPTEVIQPTERQASWELTPEQLAEANDRKGLGVIQDNQRHEEVKDIVIGDDEPVQ